MSRSRLAAGLFTLSVIATSPVSALGDVTSLPDPTQPPQMSAAPATSSQVFKHKLSSIIFSAQRRVAVVNGKVVAEGEEIDGARVLKIGQAQVWLELADKEHRTLSLNSAARAHRFRTGRVLYLPCWMPEPVV